jgi:hypothetical protein
MVSQIVSTPFLPNKSRYLDYDLTNVTEMNQTFQHLFFLIEVATVPSAGNYQGLLENVSTPFLPNRSRYGALQVALKYEMVLSCFNTFSS